MATEREQHDADCLSRDGGTHCDCQGLVRRATPDAGRTETPCRSGHTDCTVDCGWCKGRGVETGPGRSSTVQPLVPVAAVRHLNDEQNELTLTCGHVVVRRAYMGGTYARARCPHCPPKMSA